MTMYIFFLEHSILRDKNSLLYAWLPTWNLIIRSYFMARVRNTMFLISDPLICFEIKNNTNVPYEFQLVLSVL
jgi:hypothetical protein